MSYIYSFYQRAKNPSCRSLVMSRLVHGLGLAQALDPAGVIQVTGTNGKGTCVRQVERDLLASGKAVISLTSPHLTSFRERVCVDGEPLDQEALVEQVRNLMPALERMRKEGCAPTPVEIAFLIALQLRACAQEHTHFVVEVGRGGSTDYTNVFKQTLVGLTRIGRDHLEEFGDLQGVAREKIGLCSRGGVLLSVQQLPELERIIVTRCEAEGIELAWLAREPHRDVSPYLQVLRENQRLGRQLARRSAGSDWRPGMLGGADRWRFEIRRIAGKTFVLDGAHNPEAVQLLIDSLRSIQDSGWGAIFGIQAHKSYLEVARIIRTCGLFESLILVRGCRGRFVDPQHLQALVGVPASCPTSIGAGISEAIQSDIMHIAVFGSFSLAYDFEYALHRSGFSHTAVPIEQIDPLQPWMGCHEG